MIRSGEIFFLRLNLSVVGLFIGFLTRGLGFGNFWWREILRALKNLSSFFIG